MKETSYSACQVIVESRGLAVDVLNKSPERNDKEKLSSFKPIRGVHVFSLGRVSRKLLV